jgi:tetratricopeptide (TPR) repeat protein
MDKLELLIIAIILSIFIIASLVSLAVLLAHRNAKFQYIMGAKAYRKKRYTEAKRALSRTILQKPNYTDAHFMLGMTHYALKEFELAKERYDKVIELEPDYVNAFYNAAECLQLTGKYDEALEYYEKALKQRKTDSDIFYMAGYCAFMLKDYEKAERLLRGAKELSPERPDVLFFLNRCDDERCNFNSFDDYEGVLLNYVNLSKYQDFIENFNFVFARACAKAGNIKKAVEQCKRAYVINSSNPDLLTLMGLIEIVTAPKGDSRNLESAKKHLLAAAALFDEHSEAHYLLSYLEKL